jgi:hypothetical protein
VAATTNGKTAKPGTINGHGKVAKAPPGKVARIPAAAAIAKSLSVSRKRPASAPL